MKIKPIFIIIFMILLISPILSYAALSQNTINAKIETPFRIQPIMGNIEVIERPQNYTVNITNELAIASPTTGISINIALADDNLKNLFKKNAEQSIALSSNQSVTVINIDIPGKPKRLSTDGKVFDLSEGIEVEVITGSEYDATNIKPLPVASAKPSDDSKAAPLTSRPKISFVDFIKKIPAFFKNLFKK